MSQVYASYKYRRDLVEATKAFGMLGRSKALTHSQAVAKVLLVQYSYFSWVHHASDGIVLSLN